MIRLNVIIHTQKCATNYENHQFKTQIYQKQNQTQCRLKAFFNLFITQQTNFTNRDKYFDRIYMPLTLHVTQMTIRMHFGKG